MRAGSNVFYAIAVYLIVSEIVYIFGVNYVRDDAYLYLPEMVGIVSLALASVMALMLAVYLQLTDSKTDLAPEDWEEAETEDGTGILGFFSPNSIWPLAMTGSIAVLGLGVIYLFYWLILVGAVLLVISVGGLCLQYGMPKEKH